VEKPNADPAGDPGGFSDQLGDRAFVVKAFT